MNTREIERFLEADIVSRGVFQGVFSADTLPRQPRLLVCNTDESTKPGQHWIAITWILMDVENTLIRLDESLINISKPT